MPLGVHETGLSIFDPSAPVDVYASGADDDVQINAAIAKAGAYGVVRLFGEFHWDDNPVQLDLSPIILGASGASCYYGGTGHAIEIVAGASSSEIHGLTLNAEGSALTSATAIGLYIDEGHVLKHISATISEFRAGIGVQINATTNSTDWTEEVSIPHLSCRTCRKGIEFTGAGQIQDIHIGFLFWSPYDNTAANYGIIDSKASSPPTNIVIDQLHFTTDTITNCTGISYGTAQDWVIGEFVWDDNATGNVSITGTTPIVVHRANQAQGSDHFFRDANIPWSSLEHTILNTYGGQTNQYPLSSGYTATNVASGGSSQKPTYLQVYTGATANSSALLTTDLFGTGSGGSHNTINWAKRLFISFGVGRYNVSGTDTQLVGRVQFKEASTLGALGEKGVGIQIDNLAVSGESYGSSVATVDLTFNLTADSAQANMVLFLDPNLPFIQWYANGTKEGTQSTAAKIPTSTAAAGYFAMSINNGAGGGVNGQLFVYNVRFWQEE